MASPECRNLDMLNRLMDEAGLDALVAVSRTSVLYLSGAPTAWTWQQTRPAGPRLCLLVWPRQGDPTLIVGQLEEPVTKALAWVTDVQCYPEYAVTPYEKLRDVLRQKGLGSAKIGIEKREVGAAYWEQLVGDLPETTFVECAPMLDRVRAHKTPAELTLIRRACNLLDNAFLATFHSLAVGVTEAEFHARMMHDIERLGGHASGGFMLGGDHSLLLHRPPGPKALAPGDIIWTDYFAAFEGYNANMSRVGVVGKPSQRQQEVYKRLLDLEQRIFDHIRPGMEAHDLFKFYVAELGKLGCEPALPLLGHNIGYQVHEDPMIAQGPSGTIEAGMVLCIEPLIERQFHLQDQILVTDQGVELLSNKFDRSELFVVE